MSYPPRTLTALEAATKLLRKQAGFQEDLYSERIVPARALVMKPAKEIAERILYPAKEPTLQHLEWVASLGSDQLATDFGLRNVGVEVEAPESDGWRIFGRVSGVDVFDWGLTILACGYHDYSADYDVDFMLRLGALHFTLLRESMGDLSSYKTAHVLARVIDSREYATRTGTFVVGEELANEVFSYYADKARAVGIAVDNEDPRLALDWDRAHPRDVVHGYEFRNLEEPPSAEAEALLVMKWQAAERGRAAEKDHQVAKTEIAQAFNKGTLKPGRYRLADVGVVADVNPPRARTRVPFIRFVKEGT